jgi:hypothetical protein
MGADICELGEPGGEDLEGAMVVSGRDAVVVVVANTMRRYFGVRVTVGVLRGPDWCGLEREGGREAKEVRRVVVWVLAPACSFSSPQPNPTPPS